MNFIFFFILLWCFTSSADEQYIVSATKIQTPFVNSFSPTQIYQRSDLEKLGSISIPEFLQSETALYINTQGAYGGTASIRQRGLSGFTKIVVDDIELGDPSSISGNYQLQMLNLDQVESIEILNGPQSVLYGTDSVAGVIKIITRNSKTNTIQFGGGSDATFMSSAYFSTQFNKLSYQFSGGLRKTEGISSFNKHKTFKAERDSFQIIDFNPKLQYQLNSKSSLQLNLYTVKTESEIDSFASDQLENDNSEFGSASFSLVYKNRIYDEKWSYKLIHSQSNVKRDVDVPSYSSFKSTSKKVDFQNTLFWNDYLSSLFGFDYDFSEATAIGSFDDFNDISFESSSFYNSQILQFNPAISSETSFRLQNHQNFNNVNTYKQSLLFNFNKNHAFKTSYAHSFKSPTLYQLSSTLYGDKNLEPTRVHSFETTYDFKINKSKTSLTYFNNSLKNLIEFSNLTSKYQNISKAKTQGIQVENRLFFQENSLSLNYTYTDIENLTNQIRVARIPKENLSLTLQRSFNEQFSSSLGATYVGSRIDSSSGPTMPSYAILNASLKYIIKNIDYQLYIHNLLNKEYEDTFNYGTRGLSIYAWAKINF